MSAVNLRASRSMTLARIGDALLAVLFMALGVAELVWHIDSAYAGSAPLWLSLVVALAIPVPLLFRRSAPLRALIVIAALIVVPRALLSVEVLFLDGLGVLVVALYSASRHARRPRDLWSVLVPFCVFAAFSLLIPGFFSVDELGQSVPIVLAAWGIGQAIRTWARSREVLRQSLDEVTTHQEHRTEEAIRAERARIARELHDVVAHCVTVMVVQSGAARLQLATNPQASDAALLNVERTGRQALVEMRRMLGLLNEHETVTGLTPQPSLAELDALAASFAAAGMLVDVTVEGAPTQLPPGTDLSAYRIVQESLTNALAHGSPETARVVATYRPDSVEVEIVNARSRGSSGRPPGGHGIAGMRERAQLFGGTLESGPIEGGGFRVRARFPIDGPA